MTEEQFWHSNPTIISVWEQAYKERVNSINRYLHSWIGNYGISALIYSIDHAMNGRKATTKYLANPIQMFELTEEEKKIAQKKELEKFMAWANRAEKKYSKKGE